MSFSASSCSIDIDICQTSDVFQAQIYHYFRLPDVSWQRKKCIELGIVYTAPLPPFKPVPFEPHTKPVVIFQIKPDGNCFYRAISCIISGDEDVGFMIIRKSICDYIENCPLQNRNYTKYNENQRDLGVWSGTDEIVATCEFLKIPIYTFNNNTGDCIWTCHKPKKTNSVCPFAIYLANVNNVHYDVVLAMTKFSPKDNNLRSFPELSFDENEILLSQEIELHQETSKENVVDSLSKSGIHLGGNLLKKMKIDASNSSDYTARIYKAKFNHEWKDEYKCISKGVSQTTFWCYLCRKEISCAHSGKGDVHRHMKSKAHILNAKECSNNSQINTFFERNQQQEVFDLKTKVRRAEVKVVTSMAKHNIPLSFSDELTGLFQEIFPDSLIAKNYRCSRTKSTCIVNRALKPHFINELVDTMKITPFAISIDGSNENSLEKRNPMTVKVFSKKGIHQNFLDMIVTTGVDASKAYTLFSKMDSVFTSQNIPWGNCISLSVDSASVNIGIHNSIASRVLAKNANVYIVKCPCHILHNTASHSASKFACAVEFDIADFSSDIYNYFNRSVKRKAQLGEHFFEFNSTYQEVINHISIRWLSLEKVVQRLLEIFIVLHSYFTKETIHEERFIKIKNYFTNPMTEIYLLFFQSTIPIFTKLNLLLQRADPIVFLLHDQFKCFLKNLLSRYISCVYIAGQNDLKNTEYENPEIQLDNSNIYIGLLTRSKINTLIHRGFVSEELDIFYNGVRSFYVSATQYAIQRLPFEDEVIKNSQFVNIKLRLGAFYTQVNYFVEKYQDLLPFSDEQSQEKLYSQFLDYQTMPDDAISDDVWTEATVFVGNGYEEDEKYYKMDILWAFLGSLRDNATNQLRFSYLSKIAQLVLTIPHSNAEEERVFNLIRCNKTDTRNRLTNDGTLSSLLTIKLAVPEPCYKFEPSSDLITRSQKVTKEYNEEHKLV